MDTLKAKTHGDEARKELLRISKALGVETTYAANEHDEIILFKIGTERRIFFTRDEQEILRKAKTVVHTHPFDASFSSDDIISQQLCCDESVWEVITEGYWYRMKKGKRFAPFLLDGAWTSEYKHLHHTFPTCRSNRIDFWNRFAKLYGWKHEVFAKGKGKG